MNFVEDIQSQFRNLADDFADLNAQFVHVHQREEAVVEELHKTVLIIQESNEKVANAEARAAGAESRASDLETYVADLAHQLDRMIGAISTSFGPDAFATAALRSDELMAA